MRPLSKTEIELCLSQHQVHISPRHLQKGGNAGVVCLLQGTHLALLVIVNSLIPSLAFTLQNLEFPLEGLSGGYPSNESEAKCLPKPDFSAPLSPSQQLFHQ